MREPGGAETWRGDWMATLSLRYVGHNFPRCTDRRVLC